MRGVVDSWSDSAGTGTIIGDDARVYAFGKADVIEGEPTLPGTLVAFTTSISADPPRASGIQVLRGVALAAAAQPVVVTDVRLPFLSVVRLVLQVAVVSFLLWLAGVLLILSLRLF